MNQEQRSNFSQALASATAGWTACWCSLSVPSGHALLRDEPSRRVQASTERVRG